MDEVTLMLPEYRGAFKRGMSLNLNYFKQTPIPC